MTTDSFLPEGFGTLSINVQRPHWRTEVNIHSTPEYLDYMYQIRMNSENLVCYFCGFPDGPYLEPHHIDHDHTNYAPENICAACSLCHRSQHLGWVGIKNLGRLIYLPSRADYDDDKQPKYSLEVLNIIQRFYLMSSYLTPQQQSRLNDLPMMTAIDDLLNAFQRRNFEGDYHAIMKVKAEKLEAQTNIQNMSKEEKDAYFKEQAEIKSQPRPVITSTVGDAPYLTGDLHIIDLVDALCEEHLAYENNLTKTRPKFNPVDGFFDTQEKGTRGRMAVWFNPSVFDSFDNSYNIEDRLDYYNDLDYFTPQGISSIIQNIREKGA